MGSLAMAVAIASTTYLVSSIVFAGGVAVAATGATSALTAWAWVYVPLVSFRDS